MSVLSLFDEPEGRADPDLVTALNSALQERYFDRFICTLNLPCNITVCKDGRYRKRPMIGGEQFWPSGAYIGKSGAVIIQFKSSDLGSSIAEFKLSDACMMLDRFESDVLTEFVREYGVKDERVVMTAAQLESKRLEDEAHNAAMFRLREQDPRFGSW